MLISLNYSNLLTLYIDNNVTMKSHEQGLSLRNSIFKFKLALYSSALLMKLSTLIKFEIITVRLKPLQPSLNVSLQVHLLTFITEVFRLIGSAK